MVDIRQQIPRPLVVLTYITTASIFGVWTLETYSWTTLIGVLPVLLFLRNRLAKLLTSEPVSITALFEYPTHKTRNDILATIFNSIKNFTSTIVLVAATAIIAQFIFPPLTLISGTTAAAGFTASSAYLKATRSE